MLTKRLIVLACVGIFAMFLAGGCSGAVTKLSIFEDNFDTGAIDWVTKWTSYNQTLYTVENRHLKVYFDSTWGYPNASIYQKTVMLDNMLYFDFAVRKTADVNALIGTVGTPVNLTNHPYGWIVGVMLYESSPILIDWIYLMYVNSTGHLVFENTTLELTDHWYDVSIEYNKTGDWANVTIIDTVTLNKNNTNITGLYHPLTGVSIEFVGSTPHSQFKPYAKKGMETNAVEPSGYVDNVTVSIPTIYVIPPAPPPPVTLHEKYGQILGVVGGVATVTSVLFYSEIARKYGVNGARGTVYFCAILTAIGILMYMGIPPQLFSW